MHFNNKWEASKKSTRNARNSPAYILRVKSLQTVLPTVQLISGALRDLSSSDISGDEVILTRCLLVIE